MVFITVLLLFLLVLRGCWAVLSVGTYELKTLKITVVSSISSSVVGGVVGGLLVSQSLAMCSIFLKVIIVVVALLVFVVRVIQKCGGNGTVEVTTAVQQKASSSRHHWFYAPFFRPDENVSFSHIQLAIRYTLYTHIIGCQCLVLESCWNLLGLRYILPNE